jgi:hypothetical protein
MSVRLRYLTENSVLILIFSVHVTALCNYISWVAQRGNISIFYILMSSRGGCSMSGYLPPT